MIAVLWRSVESDEGTFGRLVYNGSWVHTLELPERGNAPNISRIPAGQYSVLVRQSPRYGRVYEVQSVPGRSHILLHHGNVAGDRAKGYRTHSAGCILFGSRRGVLSGQKAVLASRSARQKFESDMKFEPFKLIIINGWGA